MKKILVCLMVFIGVSFASAALAENLSGNISETVMSKYVRANGTLAYDHMATWTNVFVNNMLLDGLSIDLWDSNGYTGRSHGNEVELWLDYHRTLDKNSGLGMDIGLGYMDLSPVFVVPKGDFFVPNIEINKTLAEGLTGYARVEIYLPQSGGINQTRNYLGIRYSWKISDAFTLNQDASFLYNDIPHSKSAFLGKDCADLSWFFSRNKNLSFDIYNTLFLASEHKVHETDDMVGIGIKHRF